MKPFSLILCLILCLSLLWGCAPVEAPVSTASEETREAPAPSQTEPPAVPSTQAPEETEPPASQTEPLPEIMELPPAPTGVAVPELPLLTLSPAQPAGEPDREAIETAARSYIENQTRYSFLYETVDPYAFTVYDPEKGTLMEASLPAEAFPHAGATRTHLADPVLSDHVQYLVDKGWYFRTVRQLQDMGRDEFTVNYQIQEVNVTGDYAQVFLLESKSFRYRDMTFTTLYDDLYEIFLFRTGDGWLVFDVYMEDGFDSTHRNTDFNVEEAAEIHYRKYLEGLAQEGEENLP